MPKDYLDPKKTIGVEPLADGIAESMNACCLDVNTKLAAMVKGRGGIVWWGIWNIIAITACMIYMPFILDRFDLVNYLIGLSIVPLMMLVVYRFIVPWRSHLPMRFNRLTRKVYFHHKGLTYITNWDSIRAYLNLQPYVVAGGASGTDDHVNIEFTDKTGKTRTVLLKGTMKLGFAGLDGAKALWEYIRIYMEYGPEGLPPPKRKVADATSPKEIRQQNNPLPIHTNYWWFWPFEIALFFPLRVMFYLISYPTDLIYYYLAPHIKVKPFPPELAEPCRCNDSKKKQIKRIASMVASYGSNITSTNDELAKHEQKLLALYHTWFVDFKPYGSIIDILEGYPELSLHYRITSEGNIEFFGNADVKIVDGIPEGWQRLKLINVAELNPTYHGMKGKELRQIPIDLLPKSGFFLDHDQVKSCPTPTLSNICRNEDTLFPAMPPWLTQAQPVFVHFLDHGELAACPNDIIVMRAINVSPAFIYSLANSQAFRDYAQRHTIETPQGPQVSLEALAEFEVLMPPQALFKSFDFYAQFYMTCAINSAKESYWLKRTRNRLLANASMVTAQS